MLKKAFFFVLIILSLSLANCFAGTYDVKNFGAVGDGKTDDTAAFQAALNAAAKENGSTVFVPSGRYLLAGTIAIPKGTALQGEYRGPGMSRGTILMSTANKGTTDAPPFISLQENAALQNVAIEYPDQSAEATEPVLYPYSIHVGSNGRVEDIFLYNSYLGINLDGSHANLVRNIWGEPLKIGINVDHVYDISRIENVHFWPYFTLNKPLRSWVQRNGIAMQFGRSDWQYCINTFCYGYNIGYKFYTSKEVKEKAFPGGQTNGNFVGIGADCSQICIEVEDSFNIGVSITNGEFAPFGGAPTWGIRMQKGNTGNLTLVNSNFWAVTYKLAEVHSGSLNMTGCNINDWGVVDKAAPCFEVTGGRLNVNGCTFNKGGYLANISGENTQAMFASNMGITGDPFKVVNLIGSRAVFGTNNPEIKVITTAQGEAAEPKNPEAAKPQQTKKKKDIPEMPDH